MDKDQAYSIDSGTAFEEAAAKNYNVVLPRQKTLLIDIDDEAAFHLFEERVKKLQGWHDVKYYVHLSKSGFPRRHIYLIFNWMKLTAEERIFYQLYLGSDPLREFLSSQRIVVGDPYPTLFLERKDFVIPENCAYVQEKY